MTTILQPTFVRTSPFSGPIHSASYSDISSLDSLSYQDESDPKHNYIHVEYEKNYPISAPSSAPSSPQYTHSMLSSQNSYSSTPSSSLSLDQRDFDGEDEDEDPPFPCFGNNDPQLDHSSFYSQPDTEKNEDSQTASQPASPPPEDISLSEAVTDDQAIEAEPTRHVDYLSHEWNEEDIWSSWRYVVSKRKTISNSVRLENASWRTWMKAKNNLKTVSPETLNWLKDCDVTWLYGPLQVETKKSLSISRFEPTRHLANSSSFVCKKPILKKKSASAVILERSQSQHSLLQRAGDIIRVQQSSPAMGRPPLRREATGFSLPSYTGSSVANTPAEHETPFATHGQLSSAIPESTTPSECKHVLFNEEVRQVQAVDSEDDDKEDEQDDVVSESDEDDDCGLMMAPSRSRSNKSTPRGSFSENGKTIVPLPSTTLKYRTDTPEPVNPFSTQSGLWPTGRKLSPSPSQETLRPSRPSHNFLIDDDPELTDEPWTQSIKENDCYSPYEEEENSSRTTGMRRTASGMFMPYEEEDEDEAAMNQTLFGQAMYAVNTFKDIAHVVWNVGWNRK